jgi:hypothetical protein
MQSLDLHIVIPELAGLYDTLNERWGNDPCATDVYQVYRQKEYRNVYEQLKDISIESIALKIIQDSGNDKILIWLRGLLAENIQIYETHQDVFSNIDFDKLYLFWEDYLFENKKATLLKDRKTITHYPYQSERERELLLKENQQDINELDNERNDLRRAEAEWIGKNYYQLKMSRSVAHQRPVGLLEVLIGVIEGIVLQKGGPMVETDGIFVAGLIVLFRRVVFFDDILFALKDDMVGTDKGNEAVQHKGYLDIMLRHQRVFLNIFIVQGVTVLDNFVFIQNIDDAFFYRRVFVKSYVHNSIRSLGLGSLNFTANFPVQS